MDCVLYIYFYWDTINQPSCVRNCKNLFPISLRIYFIPPPHPPHNDSLICVMNWTEVAGYWFHETSFTYSSVLMSPSFSAVEFLIFKRGLCESCSRTPWPKSETLHKYVKIISQCESEEKHINTVNAHSCFVQTVKSCKSGRNFISHQ